MARSTDSQSMLKDLSLLVQHDNGYHICQRDNAVSWQILGICQEMSGDNHGAYQSYCKDLTTEILQNWSSIFNPNPKSDTIAKNSLAKYTIFSVIFLYFAEPFTKYQ